VTCKEALALVQSITYKPGWKITASCENGGMYGGGSGRYGYVPAIAIRITASVPEAARPEIKATIEAGHMLGADELDSMSAEHLAEIIYHWVLDSEVHEAGEFFSVGGRRPHDPHRDDGVKIKAAEAAAKASPSAVPPRGILQ